MSNNYTTAFLDGRVARENGWERICPYNKVVAEAYWLAGYDGHSFADAQQAHQDAKDLKCKMGFSRIGLNNV